MKKLLEDAAKRAIEYRSTIEKRSVAPVRDAIAGVEKFREPTPEYGFSDEETIGMLDRLASPAAVGMTGPRYFGFVIGGSVPVSLAANWLAGAWDQNAAMHEVTPAVATLEKVASDWMLDMLNLPAECGSSFVTGATVANMTSLIAARNKVLANVGWDAKSNGLFAAPEIAVFVGAEAHPTLLKALSLIGLGDKRVNVIDVDDQGRMRAERLPKVTGPAIVCAQVGNINTGAFDPIDEICDWAQTANAWVHVDGAFGLWAAASEEFSSACKGLSRADSWATDAHKWLNVPYDCGIAFVRDADVLKNAMAISADYLVTESQFRNPSDYTPELSRRARGVEVWAALRSLGRTGVKDMIERCCRHARRFGKELSAAGFDVLNDVVLNQVLVSFGSKEETLAVVAALQEDGTCWCGSTVWHGHTAMRISVSNWSTSDDDVTDSLEAMVRIANNTLGRMRSA